MEKEYVIFLKYSNSDIKFYITMGTFDVDNSKFIFLHSNKSRAYKFSYMQCIGFIKEIKNFLMRLCA